MGFDKGHLTQPGEPFCLNPPKGTSWVLTAKVAMGIRPIATTGLNPPKGASWVLTTGLAELVQQGAKSQSPEGGFLGFACLSESLTPQGFAGGKMQRYFGSTPQSQFLWRFHILASFVILKK
ncbi:MAG: hypothetical protein LBU67_01760 [Oscillospiraceae bacterium]|nr:hypothetical protein [Oscillospiraceae bacterium]